MGDFILITLDSNCLQIWDSRTGALSGQLSGSVGSVMSVAWSLNEQYILGAACDNIARVWDVNLGRLKHTLTGHIGKVYSGSFCGDGSKAVTGAHDRTIKESLPRISFLFRF